MQPDLDDNNAEERRARSRREIFDEQDDDKRDPSPKPSKTLNDHIPAAAQSRPLLKVVMASYENKNTDSKDPALVITSADSDFYGNNSFLADREKYVGHCSFDKALQQFVRLGDQAPFPHLYAAKVDRVDAVVEPSYVLFCDFKNNLPLACADPKATAGFNGFDVVFEPKMEHPKFEVKVLRVQGFGYVVTGHTKYLPQGLVQEYTMRCKFGSKSVFSPCHCSNISDFG